MAEKKELDPLFEKCEDTDIGFRIKRPEAKQVIHKSKLLKDNSNFMLICGATGTGKSTLLLQILVMFTEKLKHIMICSAKLDDDVHTAVESFCKAQKIEFYYVHDPEQTVTSIREILDKKKEDEHTLIIFDDFNINYSARGDDPYNQIMIRSFCLLRSYNCSAIAISQSYSNINTKVRENLTHRFVFPLGNIYSVRAFLDDTVGLFFTGDNELKVRNDIKNIYKRTHEEAHQFIIVYSFPPVHITLGWNEHAYPPKKEGEEVVTEETKKRGNGECLAKKRELFAEASKLGFPKYVYNESTVDQLQQFINVAQTRNKKGSNAADIDKQLHDIVYEFKKAPNAVEKKLLYYIKQYEAGKSNVVPTIQKLASKAVVNEILEKDKVIWLLRKHNLDTEMDLDED
jgi:energy-coupling factor transporter ATP-binding protein EcfA2